MSNLVDKEIELQVMTCLDALLDRANHDEYLGRIGKKEALKFLEETKQYVEIIKLRLHRLESIDNSTTSEALKDVEELKELVEMNKKMKYKNIFTFNLDTIKQALLKAEKEHNSVNLLMQELDCKDFAELRKYARCGYEKINNFKGSKEVKIEITESSLMDYNPVKHYLKWEDFIFKHTPKTIDVKMGENKYTLVVGFNVTGCELVILRNKKQQYFFLEADKQFFNDLHLERVEE